MRFLLTLLLKKLLQPENIKYDINYILLELKLRFNLSDNLLSTRCGYNVL